MDRITKTADIVKDYYEYKRTGQSAFFIKKVCRYFDYIKDSELTEKDISFLLFLANMAGLPHYVDLLRNKYKAPEIEDENISMLTLSAYIHESSLVVNGAKLHRYQKQVLDHFNSNSKNRYVLTAPTSFGKTYIVYEILNKLQYRNILLVFPSISLLSENYNKLKSDINFLNYKIFTLSEEIYSENNKNIFILTPERYLSFLDKNKNMHFDFSFVDEIYKIDNTFILDQETVGENERDIAYRLALEHICKSTDDILLAGPYMTLPDRKSINNESFSNFAKDNKLTFLEYNDYEIVDKVYIPIRSKQQYNIDGKKIQVGGVGKLEKIIKIIEALSSSSENTIIYCGRRSSTEAYAKRLLENQEVISSFVEKCSLTTLPIFYDFIEHLESRFGSDWIVVKALKGRIGIHHSLIPKYIQKEIINLFNKGMLICLFSTTTITEGVNTTAKNVIVTSTKKGIKPLKKFDAKNIAGRAGRFSQHYIGRVISVDNDFIDIVDGADESLKHKNYDELSIKTDVDYQITQDKYLSEDDLVEKRALVAQVVESGIPIDVFYTFGTIGPRDKLKLFSRISILSSEQLAEIRALSRVLASSKGCKLDWDAFQLVIDTVYPIVYESNLKGLIESRTKSEEHSIITALLNNYLSGGYFGMLNFYISKAEKPLSKDAAIHRVSNYVYNVFKYHLVKYLGLFDIFYRYCVASRSNSSMDEIPGIAILLQKLEYNALSSVARRLSDFGVPFQLVTYYDQEGTAASKNFDKYEEYIDSQIQALIE